MSNVRIGTSGFSFKDWVGVFYPDGTKKENMFTLYVEYFDAVEINSTYYRIPPERVFAALEEKTHETFDFIVKLNKDSTHERKNSSEAMKSLHESVSPLKERQKLQGFLAQFPYSFKNTGENRNYLKSLKEDCRDVPLFIEFRHDSWLNPAVYDFIDSLRTHYCCVDEPALRGLVPPQSVTTGDMGYVRFHGRNAGAWWDTTVHERYDYLYSAEELSEWIERIREIRRKVSKTFLFFNNCYSGHAVRNAKMMSELLNREHLLF